MLLITTEQQTKLSDISKSITSTKTDYAVSSSSSICTVPLHTNEHSQNKVDFDLNVRENFSYAGLIQPTTLISKGRTTSRPTVIAERNTQVMPKQVMWQRTRLQQFQTAMISLNSLKSVIVQSLVMVPSVTGVENSTTTTLNSTRNFNSNAKGSTIPLVTILIPLSVVLVIAIIIVVIYVCKKHQLKKKREETWKKNTESSISWLEAFEFPQSSRAFNDFSEHTDFSIPMGPIQLNNFAFDNFDPSTRDNITEHFSNRRRTSPAYSYKNKKRSDIYPIDDDILANHNSIEVRGKFPVN